MGFSLTDPNIRRAIERGLIRLDEPAKAVPSAVPMVLPADLGEREFQRAVVELAERHGWKCYHTHDSRRSAKGWPDLALCRTGALILAELKTDTGRITTEQTEWLDLLRTVPGLRVRLWRPSLWAAVVAELTEGGEGR
ncbi:MAG TPA: VRR-NUC domain-containing protein [Gemmata sp.]